MGNLSRKSQVQDLAVAIIDPYPIVRDGLAALIERTPRMRLVGQVGTGHDARRLVQTSHPEIAVLDPDLPDVDGLRLVGELASAPDGPKVVVFSQRSDHACSARAIRAGAAAFVAKASPPDEILQGVRCATLGRTFVSGKISAGLAARTTSEPHDLLSDREFEVLRRISQGMRISEIADCLSLSVKTVSTYRTRLLDKLEISSTAQLVRYAIEHGIAA